MLGENIWVLVYLIVSEKRNILFDPKKDVWAKNKVPHLNQLRTNLPPSLSSLASLSFGSINSPFSSPSTRSFFSTSSSSPSITTISSLVYAAPSSPVLGWLSGGGVGRVLKVRFTDYLFSCVS